MEDMVSPVFGSAGPALTKGVDLDEVFSDCYFAFGGAEGGTSLAAAPGESSNESAGEALDVEGPGSGEGSLGLEAMAARAQQAGTAAAAAAPAAPAAALTPPGAAAAAAAAAPSGAAGASAAGQKPSRGIGIGIGVAAGAASAHRGMKRELSDSNLAGAADWGGRNDMGWGGMGGDPRRSMSEQQKLERRERNREHAKRSRIRKKFMLECLQEQLLAMRKQNLALRQVVKEHMPDEAATVFEKCINEKALVLSGKSTESAQPILSDDEEETKEPNCLLLEPDFQLMQALMTSQQNFTISDPSMPDNPIGFLTLTGYTIQNVIGRNCRFLQGPGTDPRAIDIIRRGVAEGRDTSVCLMNYKADGTPFWNQFFVAALRDDTGKIVNFVGVQGEVHEESQDRDFRERLRKIPLPDELMRDDNDDAGDEM
ncbi:unnamed protein product [Ectocarpus sp. CCAP 1310/34]|nr:unnamed protein product [Ectocarpus sp. CCAP 1310/34]